ncbi:CHASE2 domain-containing protein [Acuticoccus sp. I52.16.1]|uniref:CHASE2 domain-containing protein n=1 Tax=Acuticoccus sp. I52.16.1 TaxID=2928472 RepID=UPI001FD3B11B|nr:adenylate/guanylate cyclase domain-containing protein [Acuticoccus sp. I52.16.1]UOM34068.1 adenylate/guanylate cyclase domain-containing protein [Acuticoccus sp. I52.16.1]
MERTGEGGGSGPQALKQRRLRPTRWRRLLRRVAPLTLITFALIVTGILVRVENFAALQRLRTIVFDEYQNLHPRQYDLDAPVRIIAIDEESLDRLGQWPWPRSRVADLVDRLTEMGAAAIGLDILFAEADRMSPDNIARLMPEGPERERVAAALQGVPRGDDMLAVSLQNAPAVVGVLLEAGAGPGVDAPQADRGFTDPKAGFAFAGDPPDQFLPHFGRINGPLPGLAQAALGLGALNWLPGTDQIVRTVPLLFHAEDGVYMPGLAAETLRVAQQASGFVVRSSNASGQTSFGAHTGINAVKIGAFAVPTTRDGSVLMHYTPHEAARLIPAWWVLEGLVDPDEIAGRIILVGATATGLFDLQATPIDVAIPGIEINAQLIEQIVEGVWLERPDWAEGLELVVFIVLAVLFGFVSGLFSPQTAVLVGVATIGLVFAGSYAAFVRAGLFLDPSYPSLASAVTLFATTAWVAVRERRDRRWVRDAFSRYVSRDVVENLAQDPARLTLGGEMRPMTILFTDIRGFTTIGETMDAQALTAYLNAFLTEMTGVILAHRGTIDKYMGDAIMAFWNAPLDDFAHAAHACETALHMLDALEAFNARSGGALPETAIGIGLNTGVCCVGNLGASQRFDYSVIGDDVNIASRLESQTKTYGLPILVGPRTAEQARPAGYLFALVDKVKVKGKTEAIDVFGLIGGPNHPPSHQLEMTAKGIDILAEAAQDGDVERMKAALDAIGHTEPCVLDTVVAMYRRRYERLTRTGIDDIAATD